jgi:dTDP-4-dehydrorhamnose 3,5-epimerase
MKITPTPLPGVVLFTPDVYRDDRGFFVESWNQARMDHALGYPVRFVQDNHSQSARQVLRGLHFQVQQPQGKLVRVLHGHIFDVAVDLRDHSPTFGQSFHVHLDAQSGTQLWIPPGFANGFLVLSDSADVLYKTTDYYAPAHERCLLWNDPTLDIPWPLSAPPVLSAKDAQGLPLRAITPTPIKP